MTVEEIVTEVSRDIGLPEETIERAKLYATITAIPHRRSVRENLNETDTHIVRMYFRTLLYRMATDPEYLAAMEAEIKRQVERN
jgi:hypothetical protein